MRSGVTKFFKTWNWSIDLAFDCVKLLFYSNCIGTFRWYYL